MCHVTGCVSNSGGRWGVGEAEPESPLSDMTELCQSLCIHGNCQYCVCDVTGGVDSSGGMVGVEPGQSSVHHSVSMVTVSTVFVV